MALLDVRGLTLRAGESEVVRDVGFSVEEGSTLGLIGESGGGKTLSALSVMRLLPRGVRIVSGSVTLAGRDLFSMTEGSLRGVRGSVVSMVFQEPSLSLNPTLTVGRQIGEALGRLGLDAAARRRRVVGLLDQVGIPGAQSRVDDYPFQFSGGMRQRAMIAMALAADPRLLIADEPTSALDVTVQAQILRLLADLRRERGMGMLLITHDLGVAAENADRIVVMRNGEVVENCSRDDFFRGPGHCYSRHLVRMLPRRRPASAARSGGGKVLEVEDLKVHYPVRRGVFRRVADTVRAVDGVSFDVREGATLALVGESGSGKSSLARGVLRLERAASGRVRLCGEEIGDLPTARMRPRRRRMQIVFQDPYASLNPRMRVADLVAEGMRALGVGADDRARAARVGELLERVGLEAGMAARLPHEFSGGQRQRVAIARALAVEPRVLVCDEPTSALDLSVQAQVLDLFREIQEASGVAYLFITHNISVVGAIADRVAVLSRGKVVEDGATADVLDAPRHPHTRELLGSVPKIPPMAEGAACSG